MIFFDFFQFIGFSGSSGPSQSTRLGSRSVVVASLGILASDGTSTCASGSFSESESPLEEDMLGPCRGVGSWAGRAGARDGIKR